MTSNAPADLDDNTTPQTSPAPSDWATSVGQSTTIPEIFYARCHETPDTLAYKTFVGGGWLEVTWAGFREHVSELAAGLLTLDFAPGECAAVLAATRAEWTHCDIAAQALQGVSVGIYPTCSPQQCQYILSDSATTVAFVDTQEQLDKLRLVRDQLPQLRNIVVWDPSGDLDAEAGELSLYSLLQAGRRRSGARAEVQALASSVDPNTTAILVYTSGTTGPPKGVMLSHHNLVRMMFVVRDDLPMDTSDITISFLPMSHVAERVLSFYGRTTLGVATAFARSLDFQDLLEDFQAIRPTVFGCVPRVFEKIYAKAQMQAQAKGKVAETIFRWALGVGRKVSHARRDGVALDPWLGLQHRLADWLIFARIRDIFGGRTKVFITGSAPIDVEILEFFHAAGMLILETYGMTELSAVASTNLPNAWRFGSVGKALPGQEIRIADDGEILVRGETVFQGYLNNPEATAAALSPEGWLHTGDIGRFDDDDYLYITGRKKDILITAGGKNVAPQNIEHLVKDDPFIAHCVVLGDRKPFLVALVTLDPDEAPALAQRLGLEYRGPGALARAPEVRAYVQTRVDRANGQLARVEQIRKFALLERDLSLEDGELTPTMKVKRGRVAELHREVVDALYQR